MPEDFGFGGDEFLIGDCQDDWNMDQIDLRADEHEARQSALDEDEAVPEADLCDMVREYQETYEDPDYPVGQDISEYDESASDYLGCDCED
jgi:hypothetical protein